MKKQEQGYITCYLALTLGIMLSFIFTLFKAVRVQTIRMETEGVMDIALFSIFGEFHRELLEQYDLFFIDTSYGEGIPKIQRTEEHLQYYMNQNFEKEVVSNWVRNRDLTDLHCDNVSFENYVYASDGEGQILKSQILDYMQHKNGSAVLENRKNRISTIKLQENSNMNIEGQWDEAERKLQKLVEERKKDFIDPETGEEIPIGFDNPASHIREIRAGGTLGLVLTQETQISPMVITPEYYFSHRNPNQGKGEIIYRESMLDKASGKILLGEYFLEKCSSYQNPMEKAVLKYQMEYLLHGKESDLENLEATVEDILHIREGINFVYLMTDAEKIKEAEALAWILSAVFLSPEIKDALKVTILFAWTYAESVKDVRILMDGHPLLLIKNKDGWNTPLSQLFAFTSYLGDYDVPNSGITYEDYVRYFMNIKPEKELLYRFMDLCEMDIRITDSNKYFQMDGCLWNVKAKANVSSGYGYGYQISRSYGYQ